MSGRQAMTIEPYLGRFIIRTGAKMVRYWAMFRWTALPDRARTYATEAEAQAAIDRMRGK